MAICEDAPCCGCCGRSVYGDAWAESEPEFYPEEDVFFYEDEDDEDEAEFVGFYQSREDFGPY